MAPYRNDKDDHYFFLRIYYWKKSKHFFNRQCSLGVCIKIHIFELEFSDGFQFISRTVWSCRRWIKLKQKKVIFWRFSKTSIAKTLLSRRSSTMIGKFLSLLLICITLFAITCASFSEENPTDRRVLVLLDDFAIKSSHSLFFKSLETRGLDLDFKLADDPKLALQSYGKYLYDAAILFSPTTDRK